MSKPDRNLDRPPAAEAIVVTLYELLAPETDVEFGYLFGSLAKGRPREASDVDLAVHLGGGGSPSARLDRGLELEGRLEEALGRTVQVVVLNDAPLELRFNVLHHGIPLQPRDRAARTRFFVDTGRRYYDMAPARELFRRRQAERIRQGKFGG
jgi:uncharacterized protein